MHLMGRMMTWAAAIALTLVTLWIMLQGYRIVTGQSREPMMHLVTGVGRKGMPYDIRPLIQIAAMSRPLRTKTK